VNTRFYGRDSLIRRINSLMTRFNSLLGQIKFPVPRRRELGRNSLNWALDSEPISRVRRPAYEDHAVGEDPSQPFAISRLPGLRRRPIRHPDRMSCPYQANTAGFRKGSRPTLVTMSLSFTRGWPKAFGTANLSALDLMLPSLVIA
jgi:hypothetical protein